MTTNDPTTPDPVPYARPADPAPPPPRRRFTPKRVAVIGVTVLLVAVSAVLIVSRAGWFRGKLPATSFKAVVLNTTPAADERPFAPAEDWPRWRGPRGDGISRETVGDAWPAGGLRKLWDQGVGIGFSSPVAAGGRVYLFSMKDGRRDVLSCFDARTGEQVWAVEDDAGSNNDYAGTRATPAIVGDAIYTYGGAGDVTCRALADGKQRWSANAVKLAGGTKGPQWGTASSPLVEGGKVYVQAGEGGSVAVALDAATGGLAWKSQAAGKGSYAAPILIDVDGTRQLVVFAADAVFGMNPETGQTIWRQAWATDYGVNATTPVYRDGHLYVSSEYGMGGMMMKVSATGVQRLWVKKDIKNKFNGLVLDGDTLVGNSGNGALVGVAWPGGEQRWKSDDSDVKVGIGGSFVRAAGDKVVLMGERGMLTLARMTGEGPKMVNQFEPFKETGESETQVWSTPLFYGGRVYAKGTNRLMCFELPK